MQSREKTDSNVEEILTSLGGVNMLSLTISASSMKSCFLRAYKSREPLISSSGIMQVEYTAEDGTKQTAYFFAAKQKQFTKTTGKRIYLFHGFNADDLFCFILRNTNTVNELLERFRIYFLPLALTPDTVRTLFSSKSSHSHVFHAGAYSVETKLVSEVGQKEHRATYVEVAPDILYTLLGLGTVQYGDEKLPETREYAHASAKETRLIGQIQLDKDAKLERTQSWSKNVRAKAQHKKEESLGRRKKHASHTRKRGGKFRAKESSTDEVEYALPSKAPRHESLLAPHSMFALPPSVLTSEPSELERSRLAAKQIRWLGALSHLDAPAQLITGNEMLDGTDILIASPPPPADADSQSAVSDSATQESEIGQLWMNTLQ